MKVCKECGGKHYAKGFCRLHYKMPSQLNPKPIKKSGTPIGNFMMKIKPVQAPKKQKPISPISKNRQEALRRYRRLRDKYFEQHPVCEFPDCNSTNITLHHSRGRIGSFLTDKRFFKSLCVKHHKFVEENPEEAQRLGLSKKRLDK